MSHVPNLSARYHLNREHLKDVMEARRHVKDSCFMCQLSRVAPATWEEPEVREQAYPGEARLHAWLDRNEALGAALLCAVLVWCGIVIGLVIR